MGELSQAVDKDLKIEVADNVINITRPSDSKIINPFTDFTGLLLPIW